MGKLIIGAACTFAAGMLIAVPAGFAVSAKAPQLLAVPAALVFIAGIVLCAWLFFTPGSPAGLR